MLQHVALTRALERELTGEALTSYSVAVFNGGRERRQVVFGINVLSQNSTHAVYESNAREKDPMCLIANNMHVKQAF